jgi:hypothetical protein
MFNKGDAFIAEGYTHTSSRERDGETVETEEFVAKRLGHDSARTNYTLQRRRTVPPLAPATPAATRPGVRGTSGPSTTHRAAPPTQRAAGAANGNLRRPRSVSTIAAAAGTANQCEVSVTRGPLRVSAISIALAAATSTIAASMP